MHRENIPAFIMNALNPVQEKVARMPPELHVLDSFKNILQFLQTQVGPVRRSMHTTRKT